MTIESIVSLIGRPNIAGDLDKEQLQKIADDVIERARQDDHSMKEWKDCVEEGIKLCCPEFNGKDYPWTNAANFKSTILSEASNNFGNRAAIEIMRYPKLVKASITGLATIKNVIDRKSAEVSRWKSEIERIGGQLQQLAESAPQDPQLQQMQKVAADIQAKIEENTQAIKQKKESIRRRNERADRVSELMNWQINTKMKEWRIDQKRLMYTLPNTGSLFKKTYYDSTLGRCVSKIINYPDFIVNNKTTDMETCRSFTHIMAFSKSEVEVRIKNNLWIDVDLYTDEDSGDTGGDEDKEVKKTSDNPDKFYEQYCWLDLDDDGIDEPYIVTVHVGSAQVVRIVARYDEDTIIVSADEIKPMSLLDAQKKIRRMVESENEEFGTNTPVPEPTDLSMFKVIRIEPIKILTKYGMIPSADGTFLDVGFYHLIGSLTMGVNKTTNDLLNAGTLSNLQGGIVAKNFRKKPGQFAIRPGEWTQSELTADQLMGAMLPFPYKEPSNSLFLLNEKMENSARSFSANVDVGGQLQSNTPPTTALAMIQESLIPHTAHMGMIIDSMSDEFQVLFELNRIYLDADDYKEIVGDDEAVFEEDFATDGLTVSCGANPEMSSRMQRMMLSEAEMTQVPMVIQAGGNPVPIIKNYYKRIGSENLDEIFPNEAEMSPEEKAQMEAMRQQQEYANQLAEQQVQMVSLQTELLKRGEDRKDRESMANIQEKIAKIDKLLEEVVKTKAETIKTLEEAETEATNNQIKIYTAASDELAKAEEALMPPETAE